MKEHIYTIPLTEATRENCGCVLCTIEKKLEEQALEYFLGPSLMEPDGRELTNRKGFCKKHFDAMLVRNNRLGLALMLETHLRETLGKLEVKKKVGLFSKATDASLTAENVCSMVNSCALCDNISAQMKAVANNLAYLWGKEDEFKKNFEASSGLCLKHTALAIEQSDSIGGKKNGEYIDMLLGMQRGRLSELEEKVHLFTLSFDYRNAGVKLSEDEVNSVADAIKNLSEY